MCFDRCMDGGWDTSDTRGTLANTPITPPEVLCTLYIMKRGKLHQQATTTTHGFRVGSHRVHTTISPRRGELESERAAPAFRHTSATVVTARTRAAAVHSSTAERLPPMPIAASAASALFHTAAAVYTHLRNMSVIIDTFSYCSTYLVLQLHF